MEVLEQVLTDAELVEDAIAAREEAEATEEEASPSRWREADRYAELSARGWIQERIAEECKTSQSSVSRFIACTKDYALPHNRPTFWRAYQEVAGSKTTAERMVASEENEWYTPFVYVEAARLVLGGIDLDPASSAEANEIIQATRFFTAEDHPFVHAWSGRVWLNPPYGGEAGAFINRLVDEYFGGDVTSAIALVNAHCTDTEWFKPLFNQPLCFTDHRIDFVAPVGREKKTSSTHGSVFAYFGGDEEEFVREFRQFGSLMVPA